MDAPEPLPLRTEFLFRMSLTVGPPQGIGPSRGTELRVVPVTGGTVAGPRLTAEVLPGPAGDWLRVEPDGTTHLDVRLTLRRRRAASSTAGIRACAPARRRCWPGSVAARRWPPRTTISARAPLRDRRPGSRLARPDDRRRGGQRRPEGPVYDVYAVL